MITFEELNIDKELLRAIQEIGYTHATPIQEQSIPAILEGKDVLGLSNTGTGKTAAFGLPSIMRIKSQMKHPQVLVVCPTRELVTQVATEFRKLAKYKEGIKIVPIYGGQPIDQQIKVLKKGCEIVVGTPGRIIDHLNRKTIRLTSCQTVILDEADEMLNMGFKEDITEILSSVTSEDYQTILFSATMPKAILKITEEFQHDPVMVKIKSAQRTIDTVEQEYYDVVRGKKNQALRIILADRDPSLCMIFCNTKKMVDDLNEEMNNAGLKSISLHGDMKQEFRMRVMDQFRQGNYPILIATDVAARGIDVDNIELVVNYDIPQDFESYIHRIGRTGRAGKTGNAVTLVSGAKQRKYMKDLAQYTKTKIQLQSLPSSSELKKRQEDSFVEKILKASMEEIDENNINMTNRLLSEGIAVENLVAGILAQLYKPESIDFDEVEAVKTYSKNYEAVTLKFDIGRKDDVQPGNIVAAITEECNFSSKSIGHIDIRPAFSLVDIDASKVDDVLMNMQGSTIRRKKIHVEIDKAPKRKSDSGSRSSSRGGSRNGGSRSGGSSSREGGSGRRKRSGNDQGRRRDGNSSDRGSSRRRKDSGK